MKILVITTFYPHPERKDLLRDTSAVHYIAREWVKQGHQVTVLHCYGHYFRELVKDLASVFRTRIELRQIGVRDETKILGGIGICGRPLCCHTFLTEFAPVSIKMAKEQNLSLNPTKISGVCGRLMCCLKNEEETYEYLNSRLPNVGDRVTTLDGLKGEVQSVSVLRQLVKVVVDVGDEKEIREYPVKQLKFRSKRRRDHGERLSKEEMRKLAELEDKGGHSKLNE